MNKEQCKNKISNEIKPSAHKETESIIYKKNVSNNKYDEFGSEPSYKAKSYIESSKGDKNNQDNNVFQRKKDETRNNANKDVSNVRESKVANKELTNNIHSHNIKANKCNDGIIFEKEKSS